MVYMKRSGEEERENEYLNKRSKISSNGDNMFVVSPSQYNPLAEPSPLGLRLRKSPSLIELIQMRLSQANSSSSTPDLPVVTSKPKERKSVNGNISLATAEKLKASNFPAMLLRIGDWEFVSRFDGDLVAKCYFAKHKLVWEILQNGLKSKIEIQWADIMALNANLPNDGAETLSITLARPPHFFKEINPQPRKHTLWQTCPDFTDGKASIIRQHILQCPPGVLNKHYEKLIQCDTHLNLVSQQPDVNQSPFFDERVPFFKNPNAPTVQELDNLNTVKRSPLQDMSSPSSSLNFEEKNSVGFTPEIVSRDAPSPSSVVDSLGSEGNSIQQQNGCQPQENWDQLNALGIHKSMSMQDLVNHIDQCISKEVKDGQNTLENIAQFLFSDNNLASSSDENKLMSRVNSLYCLLQDSEKEMVKTEPGGLIGSEKQTMGVSRKDSFSDLLLSLPRITSIPKILFNICEDDDVNQAK